MSTRNAGTILRELREQKNMSAEAFSEGVCDCQTLYRIERGEQGFSPATFRTLMSRAGASLAVFPTFASRADYDCFFAAEHARFHLNAWQVADAYEELEKIAAAKWADNKIYYQEWLLLYTRLLYRSGSTDYALLTDLLTEALQVTGLPARCTDIAERRLLSTVEMELYLTGALTALLSGQEAVCRQTCAWVESYLGKLPYPATELSRLRQLYAVVYARYLLTIGDAAGAWTLCTASRQEAVHTNNDSHMVQLAFLAGVARFRLGEPEEAMDLFQTAVFSAYAVHSPYAARCVSYLTDVLGIALPERVQKILPLPTPSYPLPQRTDASALSDGSFDYDNWEVMKFGKILRALREEQKLSLKTVCSGLCSTASLSKIENDDMNPNMLLAQALLQRLGVSDREFTFWGNAQETKINQLMMEMIYSNDEQTITALAEQLSAFLSAKDVLLRQFIQYMSALYTQSAEQRIRDLDAALRLTVPDFEFTRLAEYRFTWAELSILNNLAFAYRKTEKPYEGIRYLDYLNNYYQRVKPDIILASHTQTIMIARYIHSLYSEKRFKELNAFAQSPVCSILNYFYDALGMYYFFYCQTLGEVGDKERAELYGRLAYYVQKLCLYKQNPQVVKDSLQTDFGIIIP